jgi:hypothetical protein
VRAEVLQAKQAARCVDDIVVDDGRVIVCVLGSNEDKVAGEREGRQEKDKEVVGP